MAAKTRFLNFVHRLFDAGEEDPTDIVIFSDSQSALEALCNFQSNNADVQQLNECIQTGV